MRALSIRQPYAELILRGVKTIEYRSRATRIVGERFWIYASKGKVAPGTGRGSAKSGIWSRDLGASGEAMPPWMIELAQALQMFRHELPTGVIVGSAVIEDVSPGQGASEGVFHWRLAGVERAKTLRKPTRHPQPVWFKPF